MENTIAKKACGSKHKRMAILNYGCQMNVSDAERLAGRLMAAGYARTEALEEADLILVNTCCVRESAEKKIYGKIGELKRLKREKPSLIVGVAGCMAQKDGEALLKRAPHVDFVLGTHMAHELIRIVAEIERERGKAVALSKADGPLPEEAQAAREGAVSAWVPIMYGCNNFCTYCIVPYVRGRERSRPLEEVVREVEEAAGQGYKEVTLLGQNVNSYGKGSGADFAALLRAVDTVQGVERVRYMTSHPRDLTDAAIAAVADGKHICEHFHLPVQYGSDRILAAMHRGYTTAYYRALVEKIRAAVPGASLTTDLIVGFPGETEADFEETLAFLEETRYDAAYTFLYSKRSGTPAASLPDQVDEAVKKRRLQALMEMQNRVSLELNEALVGRTVEVMAEGESKTDKDVWTGRTRTNKIVLWPKRSAVAPGDLLEVTVERAQTWLLRGEAR